MEDCESERIVLGQALVRQCSERDARDIAAVDVERDERQVVRTTLLRYLGGQEHAGTPQRYEIMSAIRRRCFQPLRTFGLAHAAGASAGADDWSGRGGACGNSFLRHA